MFATLVTHTFLDNVPATFLGIPDAETSLAVLPAHALCLDGQGEEAVRISALGSAAGVALSLPLALGFVLVLPALQPAIDWGIGLIILAVGGYLVVVSESPGWAFAVFAVSGILGVFALGCSYLAWPAGGESGVLMPLLSGLFGVSVLLGGSQGKMPEQRFQGLDIPAGALRRGSILGSAAGALVGWLPGLSSATANTLLTSVVGYDSNPREYILATSAANPLLACRRTLLRGERQGAEPRCHHLHRHALVRPLRAVRDPCPPAGDSGRLRPGACQHPPGLLHGCDNAPCDGLLLRSGVSLLYDRGASIPVMLQRYWFGDIDEDGCCRAAGTEPAALAERVSSLRTDMESYTPINWEVARDCGVVRTREEYVALLRSVCMILARQKIARSYQERDVALLQMVRMLDEIDNVINLLSERAAEWYQVTDPSFSRKYRSLPAKKMLDMIRRGADGGLAGVAAEIERLTEVRRRLMREVSAMADEVMPNVSALIGGLVAARLLSRAGGLAELARMPGSTIQVLGSEQALFSHLRGGSPPPKHGIIFQHRRVHNAPKEVRGRVARVLAAKLAIAARLDHYRGEAVPSFIEEAQARIDEAGRRA